MALFKSDLHEILSDFSRTIDKLGAHVEEKGVEIAEYDEKILELKDKRDKAGFEVELATKVAENLRNIINA